MEEKEKVRYYVDVQMWIQFSFVYFEVKFVFRKVQVVDEIKLYIGNNKYINVSRLWMYNLIYVFSFIVIYLQIGFVKL